MVKVNFKAVYTQSNGSNWTCTSEPSIGNSGRYHDTEPPLDSSSSHSNGAEGYSRSKTLDVNDLDVVHADCYQFGAQRRCTLYANGKQVATSQASHGGWVNYTVNLSDIPFPVGGPDGTPTYLETLDKLDQWSSAQYIPDIHNSRNELNL